MFDFERLKRDISLPEFFASRGYVLREQESSQNSMVMHRGADNAKVVVAKGYPKNFWIFFSVRDNENGTILDAAVMEGMGADIGEAAKALTPYLSGGAGYSRGSEVPTKVKQMALSLEPHQTNRVGIQRAFDKTHAVTHHLYVEARGISSDITAHRRFKGCIRKDGYGNAVFPHHDRKGLCGFEMRNHTFRGFAKGGTKGLWHSACWEQDTQLLISEATIDALSYAQLHPEGLMHTRYFSTGGKVTPEQQQLVAAALKRMVGKGSILIAQDNDEAGEAFAALIEELAPENVPVTRASPPEGKDWNDSLTAIQVSKTTAQSR